jgi:hypothetical protein
MESLTEVLAASERLTANLSLASTMSTAGREMEERATKTMRADWSDGHADERVKAYRALLGARDALQAAVEAVRNAEVYAAALGAATGEVTK